MGFLRKKEQKTGAVEKPVAYSGWWKTQPLTLEGDHIPYNNVVEEIKGKTESRDMVKIWKEAKISFGFPEDVLPNIAYVTREDGKKVEIHIKGTQEYVKKVLTENKERIEKCYAVKINLDEVKLQPE